MKYFLGQYTGMNHLRHKKNITNEQRELKILNNIQKNTILKVKYSILELENDFKELKNTKIREIEKLFFKSINASINDMDKSGRKKDEEDTVFKKHLV